MVIGGGATGVEMAGAIAELARKALAADFRTIDPRSARVTLLEAGPRLLPAFDELLSEKAKRSLEKLGVEVLVNATVTGCDASGVSIGAERIETRTIVWGAGVRASAAGKWLGVETDRVGRVKVAPDLSVPGHSNVFVIGDTAHVLDRKGQPLPGVAPVAKQQGAYAARAIVARLAGESPAPFHYRDFGSLATIGRRSAVAQLGRVRLSGYLAWWLWGLAHIYFLIGFRNRLAVAMNWAWNYVSFQRGTRLITGADPEADAGEPGGGRAADGKARSLAYWLAAGSSAPACSVSTASAVRPSQRERIASRTSAPTPGECGRPRTVTRLTSRQNSGSIIGRPITRGWLTELPGMKPKPRPLATIARIQSSRSLRYDGLAGRARAPSRTRRHSR